MNFSDYFRYDPTSPSGLVWAKNIYNGRARNILLYSEGDICGSIHKDGHWSVAFRVLGKQVRRYCHRIIWCLVHGSIPDNMTIDHINRVRSDNSLLNMRLVTKKTNTRNRSIDSRNKSGKTGVSFSEVGKYEYAVASWVDDDGKQFSKNFPVHKLGRDTAFTLAVEHREQMIKEVNLISSEKYTEDHGVQNE